jgi:hypothetical protein
MKVKNWNAWQFVEEEFSSHFVVTNWSNGPLCFSKLVRSLFHTPKPELYVILRYVFDKVQVNSLYYVPFIVLNYFENKLKFKNFPRYSANCNFRTSQCPRHKTNLRQFVCRLIYTYIILIYEKVYEYSIFPFTFNKILQSNSHNHIFI